MIDTVSSNDFPLFGTTMSTSFGMEGIVIQRPLATESYSWSDLSIVQDDSSMLSPPTPFVSQSPSSCSQNHQYGFPNRPISDGASMQFSVSESTLSSTSTSSTTSSTSSKRSVRFAPSPMIRTYSLVLGDHPCCDDGLAIELGWEYCDDDDEDNEQNQNRNQNQIINTIKQDACQKRPYLSRKQLLLDVAGCTKEELDQRSRELEARKALIERNRSYREDYYYCLAFAERR